MIFPETIILIMKQAYIFNCFIELMIFKWYSEEKSSWKKGSTKSLTVFHPTTVQRSSFHKMLRYPCPEMSKEWGCSISIGENIFCKKESFFLWSYVSWFLWFMESFYGPILLEYNFKKKLKTSFCFFFYIFSAIWPLFTLQLFHK